MANDVRNNKIRALATGALRAAALLCATGTLMQTFLVVLGFDSSWIYIHSTLLQAANVLTIMLCSRWADTGNIIKRAAFVNIPMAISFICFLPLCILRSASIYAFIMLVAVSMCQSICTALYTVCEYKMPYYTYRTDEFGSVTALGGVISAGVTFGIGVLMNRLSKVYSYITLMIFAFIIAALFIGATVIIGLHQKSLLKDNDGAEITAAKEKVPFKKVFLHPVFLRVWPAHLLRGFAYGVLTVLAVVAVDIGFDESVTTAMVSVQSVATLLGCIAFGFASRFLSPRISVFVGSISTVLLPLMLVADDYLFLALYAVILFGRALVDYGVVALMLYAVPLEIAGPYNAWRMILHNGGTLIATTVAAFIPVSALLWITFICGVVSGVLFLSLGILRRASPTLVRKKD